MEIERKFLPKSLICDLTPYKQFEIEQAYISVDPTIRLRRQNSEYYLTFKQKGLLAREEAEFTITKAQFDHLWEKIETNPIRKTRALIPLADGLTAEIDVYHGVLEGLVTIEVEFISLDQAKRFDPPNWFGAEVTEDPNYSNSSLAVNGMRLINR